MNNKYVIFAGFSYYPVGGMGDYQGELGAFDTVEDARSAIDTRISDCSLGWDWWQVAEIKIDETGVTFDVIMSRDRTL